MCQATIKCIQYTDVVHDRMHACMMLYICGKMHDFLVNMKLEIY